jgi:hypothetical protein
VGKGKDRGGKKFEGVLEGHQIVGKRLKADFLTKMNFQFVSYVDEVIPEIVLLGLLNDAHGYQIGAELSLKLTRALRQSLEFGLPTISGLATLSPDQVARLANALGDDMESIRIAFTPFMLICPDHSVCNLQPVDMEQTTAIGHLKTCVGRLYDRYSTPACAAMANLYYVQACTGRIHIAKGLRVPDLESIIARPGTDAADHASSSVRSYTQSLIGQVRQQSPSEWPDLFWNKCYQMSDCELYEDADD